MSRKFRIVEKGRRWKNTCKIGDVFTSKEIIDGWKELTKHWDKSLDMLNRLMSKKNEKEYYLVFEEVNEIENIMSVEEMRAHKDIAKQEIMSAIRKFENHTGLIVSDLSPQTAGTLCNEDKIISVDLIVQL